MDNIQVNELFKKLQELYAESYASFTPEQKEEAGEDVSKWLLGIVIEAEGEGFLLSYADETPDWLVSILKSYIPRLEKKKI